MADDVRPDGIKQGKRGEEQNQRQKEKAVAEKRAEYLVYQHSRDAGFVKIGQNKYQTEDESANGKNGMFGLALQFSEHPPLRRIKFYFRRRIVIFFFIFFDHDKLIIQLQAQNSKN